MAAKQSAEMKHALELVAIGISVREAAKQAGVCRESVYHVLRQQRNLRNQQTQDKEGTK